MALVLLPVIHVPSYPSLLEAFEAGDNIAAVPEWVPFAIQDTSSGWWFLIWEKVAYVDENYLWKFVPTSHQPD